MGAGSSAAFSPSDIASLLMWIDASDSSTLYQDPAKTTPSSDADPVGAIADKTVNGNDWTQATAANKPTYDADGVNGMGAVQIADTTDRVDWGYNNANFATDPAFTFFLVFTGGTTGGAYYWDWSNTNINTPCLMLHYNGATSLRVYADIAYPFNVTITSGETLCAAIRVEKPASNWLVDFWVNGTKETQYDAGTAFGDSDEAVIMSMGHNNFSTSIPGYRCEALYYNAALSDSEVGDVNTYLQRWGWT